MKTRIAAALSIAGVLAAGSVAAVVNTQILDGSNESSASAAVLPPPATVELTVPTTTLPDAEDATTETSAPVTTTQAAEVALETKASQEFLTAFTVGGSGVVTVDVIAGVIILVKAEPADGWSVLRSEEDPPDRVEVEFASPVMIVEFVATFDGVSITPSVSSRSIAARGSAPGAVTSTTTPRSDDDRDDDHEADDDDHEEADHEDDRDDHEEADHEDDHEDDHGGEDEREDDRDDD